MKFSTNFVNAINDAWNAIAFDVYAIADETGEPVDNLCAVEMCIDADRLATFGGESGKAAQEEFRARVHETDYMTALQEAADSLGYSLV